MTPRLSASAKENQATDGGVGWYKNLNLTFSLIVKARQWALKETRLNRRETHAP